MKDWLAALIRARLRLVGLVLARLNSELKNLGTVARARPLSGAALTYSPAMPLNAAHRFSFSYILCGLIFLVSPQITQAQFQIGIQDGPSPINFGTTTNLNTATFTVSANASVLVVFYATRATSGGNDPGNPATLSWNGHTLTRAITATDGTATWDDNSIYYLVNPPAGTGGITGMLATNVAQNWWMAYTLSNVNTSIAPSTGAAGIANNGGDNVSDAVNVPAAGCWAAVNASGSATNLPLVITATPSGGTVITSIQAGDGGATQTMGGVSNCPAGSNTFIATSGAGGTTLKMAICEAVFTPSTPPTPATPTGFSTTGGSPAQVNLSWNASANATSYILQRSTNSGGPYALLATISSTNYQDIQVISGTTYYYEVAASNALSGSSAFTTPKSATPSGPPFAPGLSVGNFGTGRIRLSWSSVFGATSYNLKRSLASGGEVTITNITGIQYVDAGLTAGAKYYYEVSALGVGGESANSPEVGVVALAGWYLFDNFSADNLGPLNGQTGSAGLGIQWTNIGGGTPINVANGGPFGSGKYAQYNSGIATGAGDYETGLGIGGSSFAATVFLQFSLPGIQTTNGIVSGNSVVSINICIDTNNAPPNASTASSAQINYDNSSSAEGFRVNNAGTFDFIAITSGGGAYTPVPGYVYNLWFVINAVGGTYSVYMADASVSGTNLDSGGLGSAPTLLYAMGSGSSSFGFRNASQGVALNTIVTAPGSQVGTVSQAQIANIYVDPNSADLVNPLTGTLPFSMSGLNATAIQANSATLGGSVVSTGNSVPAAVTIFYGPSDGGTNAAAWASSVAIGQQTGAFSQNVTGLSSNTLYYFTAQGSTAGGVQWAVPSLSFRTAAAITPAQIANEPVTAITATAAALNGQVLSTGGGPPSITLYYGMSDGSTNAANWANSLRIHQQTAAFSGTVSGLSSNTSYFFSASASNAAGITWATPSLNFTTLASNPPVTLVSVLTYKYDNSRDGMNTNEVLLTPANVNVANFARLFTYTVDGYCYSSPLYVAGLQIPGQGTHNVVFIGTENDSVYAFDADSNTGPNGGLLWYTNLGIAEISINNYGVRYHHNVLNPLIGITGTPVIDPVSGSLFVDTFVGPIANTNSGYHVLHALNITNGSEQPFSPVLVHGSVPGVGVDSVNGMVTFAPSNQMNRPALTLDRGRLYLAYGSYGDTDPYHGWVITFNSTNLQPLTNYVFASTPNATTNVFGVNAGEGAIWQGGDGLCVDASGNLYFETGNGSFSAWTNGGDYGDSFVKLSSSNGLAVADYFTPYNQHSMDVNDLDLGSGGPILLPDEAGSAAHPHLITGAGKEGTIYLLDRENMGHWIGATNPGATKDLQIVQELQSVIGGMWSSPAYWNHLLYWQGAGDVMKAYGISNAVISSSPASQTSVSFGDGYSTPSVSANGTSNGIAWVIQTDAYANNGPAILYAYNATNLSQQLYNSSQNLARDNPGPAVKYAVPIVANGKVYVRGEYTLSVFGLGIFLPAPVISPNGGIFTNSVIITLADASNSTSIYYTLDGTTPTTNSFLYSGPFVLTNSAGVNAIAIQPGAFNSPIASASFINNAAIGHGDGLTGQYWANTSSTTFTNLSFTNLPTLVRTDAVVNFNWGSSGPTPAVGATNYVVRWTGTIQPQFSEQYTLYTTADDGVRLFINGQLLINDWANQAPTTESNTIPLVAQQLYNVQLDYYYQNDNGSQVSLSWSSPSTPFSVIPQSQLYPYTNPPPAVVISSPADSSIYTSSANVSIGVMADATYNSLSKVDFYANGGWLGSLSSTATPPLYSLTATSFGVNPGGETANSLQAAATPNADVNLTTVTVEPAGMDWTAAIWQTNGNGTAVPPVAGQTYSLVYNGTSIGNGLNNTRIRSPDSAATAVFPGDSLTLNTNTELRAKFTNSITLAFPGVGANPGLILNGGMLNDGADGLAIITGSVQVTGQSYNSAQGENGGGGGLAANPRAFTISANLSGSGNFVIMNCSTNLPQIISGVSNTFTGQWIVQCGWLQGASGNSLGTNSITVDPLYVGYLTAMPGATSPNGPALFEVNYDLASSGALTLANGGLMNLHQNCTFTAVTIQGVPLAAGTYSYTQLAASYPNNFLPGGSGSITVNPPSVVTPGPVSAPTGLNAAAGNGQVYLSWKASPGATNYNVKRSTTSGGTYTTVASVTGTSYTDMGLANGVTYYYVVSANSAPGYSLTAVATDGSGLSSTSAPVHITVNAGSGLPYGLGSNQAVTAFLNMPTAIPAVLPGSLPTVLSGTGAYVDTPNRAPAGGLIPYVPNTPLWSDGATKSRYMAVPNHGGPITPDEQIAFLPTNTWTFPAGTVFVKNFDLVVNETNASVPLRRLETRLLVRDINGAVYGVTYKWRPDNSDADLLTTSLNEDIQITNATGVRTQTWYYPSPADCLTCHTPVANYVLGVNTRQLNGNLLYSSTGVTDNQLRALSHFGLFNPAINEANISNYAQLSAITNLTASLEQRSRSYFDANCAQCHQPGGTGATFDARYDTPLASQDITNYPAQFSLGVDNACVIKADDIWRSMIYQRMNTTDPAIKMPPLARNLVDINAVQVISNWIYSLPGTPALPPPTITPNGGGFNQTVTVTMQGSDPNAKIYYTTDGTLPTSNSSLYSAPLVLTSNVLLTANEFETNYANSVAASAKFIIQPLAFSSAINFSNHIFQMQLFGTTGNNYVLETTTNFIIWTPISTNPGLTNPLYLADPAASNFPRRFYRVLQQ